MKLRKTLLTLAESIPLIFLAGCSSPLIYSSIWQDKPVTIDGKATEWKIPLDYYDDKTKLNFSVSNDKTNLYFCIRATEDETQKGIIHTGLQIWIDTTGGKRKQIGIQFPIIQRGEKGASGSSASWRSQSSGTDETPAVNILKRQYSGATSQIRLTGFSNVINGLASVPNIYGINACLNWDTNNIMIYEVSVPFNTFYKSSLSASDSAKVLGISFIATVAPPRNEGGEGEGGGHGGGMGGGEGGGMGGGMGGMHGGGHGGGGHGGGGGSSGPETLTTYIKIRLATGHL